MRIHPRGAILAGLAVALATLGAAGSVTAAGNTLRIEPPTQSVATGATFTIRVVQNASVPTSGSQASVVFDKTKVQITAVTRGTAWADSPLLAPANVTPSIAKANSTGTLKTIAALLFPPDTVPTGDADVLVVTFTAKACGKVTLGLPVGPLDAALLDGNAATYGKNLKVTATGGTVTICAAATTPTPTASIPAGSSPTPTPSAPTPAGSAPPSSAPTASPSDSASPADSAFPSDSPSDSPSASPSAAASPTTDVGTTQGGSDGGPPWIPIGLAVVAVAAVGGLLLRRSMRT